MSLRPNLARLIANIRRCGDNVLARRRSRYRRRENCFHPPPVKRSSEYLNERTNHDLASTVLSRNPRAQIREPQTIGSIGDDDKDVQKGGFLVEARETILVITRIAVVISVINILLIVYVITRLTHTSLFPPILRKGIEFLGPIFIKFGQWMSTRRDVFPRDICDILSQLQRNATPHPWLYTERLLEATYGRSWRNLFVRFDEDPIGSGCCAQVYKAWIDVSVLQDPWMSRFVENRAIDESGEFTPVNPYVRKLQAVAVKVLHPGIKGQLKRDIAIMRSLFKCVTYFVPKLHWLSLTDCIDEFARIIKDQIFFGTDWNWHNSNEMILVESFHEGLPISNYLEHDDVVLQRKLAKIGITTILKMIFQDNFIHCDLHPGNILVEKAIVPKAGLFSIFRQVITPDYVADDPRLIILDCGLVVSLNDRCRQNLRDVFYSVLMGNGEMAAQHILEHSSHATHDPDGFKCSMRNIVKIHLCNPFNVNVSTVVSELFSAMVRHGVKQDGSFSSVILSMLVIEGLGRSLDPGINIFTEILPYVLSSAMYNKR